MARPHRLWAAVIGLLSLHYALAASSLIRENPTVDEVVHLPAGVSYWQTGTFKLYRHNPPLVKLVAVLPVVLARPVTGPAYQDDAGWRAEYTAQARFAQYFQALNLERYFELFTLARLVMPLWSVLGGLAVFAWSRAHFGSGGGLLSLALWCFCPNVLAHARLVTSDVAAAAVGCAATFLFWRYLSQPGWQRAVLAGLALGVAQLTKFSLLLLLGVWPLLWLFHELATHSWSGRAGRTGRALLHGAAILAVAVLTIDAGYLFEGVGTPLGRFDFASRSLLTRPGEDPRWHMNPSRNPLIDVSWKHRVNRFRGTPLEQLPSPLPRHYLLGFDEQKIEADGIPLGWIDPDAPDPEEVTGYPVYLDGVLRRKGWRSYYIKTLLYKIPEGTWILVALGALVTVSTRTGRAAWPHVVLLWTSALAVLGAMTFLTDINLGLRYVLPMLPYIFISCGIAVPWAASRTGSRRWLAWAMIGAPIGATVLATMLVHPHYLAYFNWASGGPARGSEHLIDSNLDWGQDLVGLREWLRAHPQDQPIGLAYFGQISPTIFAARGDGFAWTLPPALPGRIEPMVTTPRQGPDKRLEPKLYAISASLLRGLPWRLYDPIPIERAPSAWLAPSWNTKIGAFDYFRELEPLPESIGHSILLYRVSPEEAARLNAKYWPGK
jgi:hypothetical protein